MIDRLRKHHISFQNAFSGLIWSLRTQPNFQIHAALSIAVLLLAVYFRISSVEYVILIFTIVLGFVAEMVNTAIECVTDLVTTEWKKEAKIAKDVSAGMMLTVAFGAIGVAIVIFLPYLFV